MSCLKLDTEICFEIIKNSYKSFLWVTVCEHINLLLWWSLKTENLKKLSPPRNAIRTQKPYDYIPTFKSALFCFHISKVSGAYTFLSGCRKNPLNKLFTLFPCPKPTYGGWGWGGGATALNVLTCCLSWTNSSWLIAYFLWRLVKFQNSNFSCHYRYLG